eukprot:4871828-Amphidinium_carterae.1
MTGCVAHTKERVPICFQYNMGTCASGKQPGERCNRGLHVCAKMLAMGWLVRSCTRTVLTEGA